jgi:histone-lysine N-methyltransferase SETD1
MFLFKVYGAYGTIIQPHLSGSARTEEFYKIPMNEKRKYVQGYQFEPSIVETLEIDKENKNKVPWHKSRLEPGLDLNSLPDIVRYNLLQLYNTRLHFGKSRIHEWGVFALEDIEYNDIVIEYVGEVIGQKVADLREKQYEMNGIGSSYLFRVDEDMIIDATTKGNMARFINHCCEVSEKFIIFNL